ncbi:MAG: hypothetical protein PHR51_01050 [Patescibacteria group bacterium]|nr:hypothetical protein [Patescibacteria group bacterium]
MKRFFQQLGRSLQTAESKSKPIAVHFLALTVLVLGWAGYSLYQSAQAADPVGPEFPGGDFTHLWMQSSGSTINENDPVLPFAEGGSQLSINLRKDLLDAKYPGWTDASYSALVFDPTYGTNGYWYSYSIGADSREDLESGENYTFRWKPGYNSSGQPVIPTPAARVVIKATIMQTIVPEGGGAVIVNIMGSGWGNSFALSRLSIKETNANMLRETTKLTLGGHQTLGIKFAVAPASGKSYVLNLGLKENGQTVTAGDEYYFAALPITGNGSSKFFTIAWDQVGYALNHSVFDDIPSDRVEIWSNLCDNADQVCYFAGESRMFEIGSAITSPVTGDTWHIGEIRNIDWTVPYFEGDSAGAAFYIKYKTSQRLLASTTVSSSDIGVVKSFEYVVGEEDKHSGFTGFPMQNVQVVIKITPAYNNPTGSFFFITSDPFTVQDALFTLEMLTPETKNQEWISGDTKKIEFMVVPKVGGMSLLGGVSSSLNFALVDVTESNDHFWYVRNDFVMDPTIGHQDNIYSFDWEVGSSPNGNSLLKLYPDKAGKDLKLVGQIGARLGVGQEYYSEEFKILAAPLSDGMEINQPAKGDVLIWGDTSAIELEYAEGFQGKKIDIYLTGHPVLDDIRLVEGYDLPQNSTSVSLPWDIVRGPIHCAFGRPVGSTDLRLTLQVFLSDDPELPAISESGEFAIESPFGWQEPLDGTCQWPGGIPSIEYTSGTTLNGELKQSSHFQATGTAQAMDLGVFISQDGSDWTRIVEKTELTLGSDGTIEFDWEIPATTVSYQATLMFAYASEGPIDPDNVNYFAKTYPFAVLPTGSAFDQSGTYFSPMIGFDFADAPAPLAALGNFIADDEYNTETGNILYAVQFLDEDQEVLGIGSQYASDANGYWLVADNDSLAFIDSTSFFPEIRYARFRATLQSFTYSSSKPKLFAMSLTYEVNVGEQVALINFANGEDNEKTVMAGESVAFQMAITPAPGHESVQRNIMLSLALDPDDGFIIANYPATVELLGDGATVPFEVTLLADVLTPVDNTYTFVVSGVAAGEANMVVVPSPAGTVAITGAVENGSFGLDLVSNSKSGLPESEVEYVVEIDRQNDFSGSIAFTVAGELDSDWADFSPAATTGDSTTLTVTIPAGTDPDTINFEVVGTSGELEATVAAVLTVLEPGDGPAITINLTVPVEGETTYKANTPTFLLRLYSGLQKIFEDTFYTNQSHQAAVEIDAGVVSIGETYTPLVRSTRHLWAKGPEFTVTSGKTAYTVTFTTPLLTGDLHRDADTSEHFISRISGMDLDILLGDYGEEKSGLLSDLDNNSVVNGMDLDYILKNWDKMFSW